MAFIGEERTVFVDDPIMGKQIGEPALDRRWRQLSPKKEQSDLTQRMSKMRRVVQRGELSQFGLGHELGKCTNWRGDDRPAARQDFQGRDALLL